MAHRISSVRSDLVKALEKNPMNQNKSWTHITDQIGMFAYTGLSGEQVDELLTKDGIYLTRDGRMSFAHPDILLGLSILAFRYNGLRTSDLKLVINELRRNMLNEPGGKDTWHETKSSSILDTTIICCSIIIFIKFINKLHVLHLFTNLFTWLHF